VTWWQQLLFAVALVTLLIGLGIALGELAWRWVNRR
jgi:hypothetical protein